MKNLRLIIALIVAVVFVALTIILLVTQTPKAPDDSSSEIESSSEPESSLPEESSSSQSSEEEQSSSEESSESSESESESSSKPESSSEAESSSESSVPESSESSDESSESQGESSAQSSEESSDETSKPAVTPGTVDTSGYSYTSKVPVSPAVDNSYFDDAIFIGDSITEGIKAYNLMSNTTVVSNVGISLFNVATRQCINTGDGTRITIPQAIKQHPNATKIYIMLGVNGLNGTTVDNFKSLYGNFIDIVRTSHPNAEIYIVSMFPINEKKFYNSGYPKGITNKQIDQFNFELMKLCTAKGVNFLYVAECIKEPNGELSAKATGDGMHIGP
ncbi:MAG: hypothetical protein IJF27_05785, partial [Oscillospiraceae bacterium]|nr:hypothetical protein [Oscillospiraceae bacterium]